MKRYLIVDLDKCLLNANGKRKDLLSQQLIGALKGTYDGFYILTNRTYETVIKDVNKQIADLAVSGKKINTQNLFISRAASNFSKHFNLRFLGVSTPDDITQNTRCGTVFKNKISHYEEEVINKKDNSYLYKEIVEKNENQFQIQLNGEIIANIPPEKKSPEADSKIEISTQRESAEKSFDLKLMVDQFSGIINAIRHLERKKEFSVDYYGENFSFCKHLYNTMAFPRVTLTVFYHTSDALYIKPIGTILGSQLMPWVSAEDLLLKPESKESPLRGESQRRAREIIKSFMQEHFVKDINNVEKVIDYLVGFIENNTIYNDDDWIRQNLKLDKTRYKHNFFCCSCGPLIEITVDEDAIRRGPQASTQDTDRSVDASPKSNRFPFEAASPRLDTKRLPR